MSFRKVAGLLLLAACSSATQKNGGEVTGATAPQVATEQFLRAANAGDLQAMSAEWGTEHGPARESMDHTQLEKRLTILACYLKHDSARIVGEAPGTSGHREVRVELRKGNLTRQTTFYTIKGPGDRWYVENTDLASIRDFCGNTGTTTR
ncbi:MAG TPA: hypothetical protein VIH53_05990 [Gemmatimonadaceae bacterium]